MATLDYLKDRAYKKRLNKIEIPQIEENFRGFIQNPSYSGYTHKVALKVNYP
ncbi:MULTISPECIES: hypothetical protein [unclassified Methanosarcina]|uniref:hypothetical protein n=1 Tax=unclassified Methanosarcina TaxID=2644672 RepID=UPI000A91B87F|nr:MULTISPECIES: hypothetical protein [unclassified Methanosarcina]